MLSVAVVTEGWTDPHKETRHWGAIRDHKPSRQACAGFYPDASFLAIALGNVQLTCFQLDLRI